MKNYLLLTGFILFAGLTITSCKESDEQQVKKNSEQFLSAIISGNFEKAKELTTVETQNKWGDFVKFVSENMTQEKKNLIAKSKIDVSEVKVQGETAEALCSATIPYFALETTILHLKKVDGKWLIDEPGAIVTDVIKLKIEEDVRVLDVDSIPQDSTVKK